MDQNLTSVSKIVFHGGTKMVLKVLQFAVTGMVSPMSLELSDPSMVMTKTLLDAIQLPILLKIGWSATRTSLIGQMAKRVFQMAQSFTKF